MTNAEYFWCFLAILTVCLVGAWLWCFALHILEPMPATWETCEMSKERTGCKARQFSDQMLCGYCGLQWDMNDPDPPVCRLEESDPTKAAADAFRPAEPNVIPAEVHFDASDMISDFPEDAVDVYGDPAVRAEFELSADDDPLAEVRTLLAKGDE